MWQPHNATHVTPIRAVGSPANSQGNPPRPRSEHPLAVIGCHAAPEVIAAGIGGLDCVPSAFEHGLPYVLRQIALANPGGVRMRWLGAEPKRSDRLLLALEDTVGYVQKRWTRQALDQQIALNGKAGNQDQ